MYAHYNKDVFMAELRRRVGNHEGSTDMNGRTTSREDAVEYALEEASLELGMHQYAAMVELCGGENAIRKAMG